MIARLTFRSGPARLLILSLALTACAGPAPKSDLAAVVQPTYFDHVGATRPQSLKSALHCADEGGDKHFDLNHQVAMANACVASGQFAVVEKIGDRLAVANSLTPWGPYFLSLAASARGDFARAQWMIDLSLKKAPNEGLLHFELARLDWQTHQEAAAVAEFRRASDLNAALFGAHFVTGQLAVARGNYSEGRKYLERAGAVDATDLALLLTRAELEIRTKDFAQAEKFLGEAVGHHPETLKARLSLVDLQEQRLKKSAEALANLRQVKALGLARKLDGPVPGGLDERIRALEKLVAQTAPTLDSNRRPSAEKVN